MENFTWLLDNFALGMHTEPAKTEGGERYAAAIQNLRIDADGWLRERSAVSAVGRDGDNITGIAATPKHIFILRSDGDLHIRKRSDLNTELSVAGDRELNLSGRISVVDFNTYIILTSEGTDQGLWIDVRDEVVNFEAHPLGIAPPAFTPAHTIADAYANVVIVRRVAGRGTITFKPETVDISPLQPQHKYYYKFTYERGGDEDTLFLGAESNPQERDTPILVQTGGTSASEATLIQDTVDSVQPAGNNLFTVVFETTDRSSIRRNYFFVLNSVRGFIRSADVVNIPPGRTMRRWTLLVEISTAPTAGAAFSITRALGVDERGYRAEFTGLVHSPDNQASRINVYRSNAVELGGDEDDAIQYRKVGTVARLATHFIDNVVDLPVTDTPPTKYDDIAYWEDQALLREDNDRLPADAKSLTLYNDLIFAPVGDRLVYSDIRDGNITPWAFPAVNEIRTGAEITFCAEIREVLLFGGRGRLSRLTGTDEYNFNIDTLSHRGPLDGHSWNRLTDALAYIGEGGFFLTDASQVQAVSDPVLNKVFKDKRILTGSVVFLQDGDILFDFETANGREQYKLEDGAWAKWSGLSIVQAATIIEKVNNRDQATLVLIADSSGQTKQLDWNTTAGANDASWYWQSNIISGLAEGVGNKFKRFRELEWTGQATGDVTLEVFDADNLTAVLSTKVFRSRESLRPVRVPINRRLRRIVFKISGTGTTRIQGLRLEMQA